MAALAFLLLSVLLEGARAGFNSHNLQNEFRYVAANSSGYHDLEAEAERAYRNEVGDHVHRIIIDHLPDPNPSHRVKRMITDRESARWPKGIIPYIYVDKTSIREYKRIMALYEDSLCLRFVPWTQNTSKELGIGHPGHLKFKKGKGCVTVLGLYRRASGQNIYCCGGYACVHEIGHILGMYHEQNNPLRDGWIRDNPENIWPGNRGTFKKSSPRGKVQSFPYDLSSAMNYQPWTYSVDGPWVSVLFPELSMTRDYYYMFMEIAWAYKCKELPPCDGRKLNCVNDGFQSSVRGQCTCKCPTGLDPASGCAKPTKKVSASWPRGEYALPKLQTGCPSDGNFADGHITHYGQGKHSLSAPYNMMGEVKDSKAEHHFCTRTLNEDQFSNDEEEKFNWPLGHYCIYRKGGKCPAGFYPSHVQYDDVSPATNGQRNSQSGTIPDGVYGDETRIEMCCQYKGFLHDPAVFPTDKPFALLRMGRMCQQVKGMRMRLEYFGFDNAKNGKFEVEGLIGHYINKRISRLYLYYCHYTPSDMDCGAGVVLNKTTSEITIQADSKGRTDMECTWVVRGDNENGTLVLDFETFDLKGTNGKCSDNVEVRHARIGAQGLKYCGEKIKHSIRTITNKILVRFTTIGASSSSFEAKIRWVPNEELCYDAESRGVSYNGKTNYTRMFKPCLPWSQTTHCQHDPFKQGDQHDNLEGNYCRNPDNSFRPWCYTDTVRCKRNYCDVCQLETPYDQIDYCDKLKETGFCSKDHAKAQEYCAKTCNDELPSKVKKYFEIKCSPPSTPPDGTLVDSPKSKYNLGDTVRFQCKRGPSVVTTKCMTSEEWTPVAYACLECPEGYAIYNDTCFGLMHDGKTYSKGDARKECEDINGTIAVPKSPQESNVIHSVRRNRKIWLSVNDIGTEGKWVYDDGGDVRWTEWLDGQPNNHRGREDCAAMSTSGQKWTDDACTPTKLSVVCAIKKTDNIKGKDLLGNYCTDLLTSRPTVCRDYPDYVQKYCAKTCGIRQDHSTNCKVQSSGPGVVVLTTRTSIPVGEIVSFSCAKFLHKVDGDNVRACQSDGTLSGQDLKCGECPVGYRKTNEGCYGFIEARVFTFKEAREECREVGGFEASSTNSSENDLISSLRFGQTVWVGVTYVEDQFVREDGTPLLWNNFADGEPKHQAREDCVMMDANKTWTNSGCSQKLGVVCFIPREGSDMCYDPYDKGTSYNGQVYYTSAYELCLPWTEVANCPHHAFNQGDALHNLDENYCRNPDNSLRPWCYTDANQCTKSYCNVCDTDLPVDISDDCEKQKRQGLCQSNPARAFRECATTCKDQLLAKGGAAKYTEVQCKPPTDPVDGKVVSRLKSKYQLGEIVTLKCNTNMFLVNTSCLTNGQWSPVGLVCTECPLGYQLYNGLCYTFKDKNLNYYQAQAECGQIGGHLPMPKTAAENKFVHSLHKDRYIWLGATDKVKEGEYLWGDGTNVEWNNWKEMKPNRLDNCLVMKPSSEWDDQMCEFTWSKMGVVCSVPKYDSVTCQDFLHSQCLPLLLSKPTMCEEFKDFSATFCAKTCGVCGATGIECTVQLPDPNDNAFAVNSCSIAVGEYTEYRCNTGYKASKGDRYRACRASGQLTGLPLVCKGITENIVKVGSTTLTKGEMLIPERAAFTGENAQLRIKNNGQIVAWEYYSDSPMETSFQVWRRTKHNQYRLVGQNNLTTGNSGRQRYEVPDKDQISVVWGDLIGIWNAGKGGVRFHLCNAKTHPHWDGVSWSKKHSSASDFHVGDIKNFQSLVGCCQFFFRADIFVKDKDNNACEDSLVQQCRILLVKDPKMCRESTESSLKSCAKTCGFCGAHDISCPVQPQDAHVSVSDSNPSIPVGAYVHYRCTSEDYIHLQGDATRACQPNGQLTGTEFACRRKRMVRKVIVGSPTLTRGKKPIPEKNTFTGENDQLRIMDDGRIVAWEYYSRSAIMTSFQVWRKTATNKYLLVGQNIHITVKEKHGRYEVPENEQIKAKKGDLIGIWNSVKDGGIYFTVCDSTKHPGWGGVSWSKKRPSASSFKVGRVESFSSDPGCCQFFFNAEIAVYE